MEEIEFLLSVPGMPLALRLAPLVAVVVWIFITVNLWRGGFTDLTERLSRPRYAGPERARAVMMIPLRALMLAGVAGFAARGARFFGLVQRAWRCTVAPILPGRGH